MLRNLSFIVLVLALYQEVNGDSKGNPEAFLDVKRAKTAQPLAFTERRIEAGGENRNATWANGRQYLCENDAILKAVSSLENANIFLERTVTSGMIVYNGYPTQTHTVVTEDGYALTVHRIPRGRGKRNSTGCDKGVVLLVHGISGSSASWVYTGKDNALAYMLADDGYDVWIANARGNEYSTMYTRQRDPRTREFWDFSLTESGVYDLPAVIDYILEKTGKEKIIYVGHSMGTTLFYIMMSQLPEYNEKITVMISLAPIVYTSHTKSGVGNVLAFLQEPLSKFLNLIGFTHIMPVPHFLSEIRPMLCIDTPLISNICQKFLILVEGVDLQRLNPTFIPAYLNNPYAGAPIKQMMHLVQLFKSGRFCQYNYGKSENLKRYNRTQPPSYNISETKVPVAILYSDSDTTANVIDVMKLYNELPNVIKLHKVPCKDFNHIAFVTHKDIATLVNKPVIDILHLYCT